MERQTDRTFLKGKSWFLLLRFRKVFMQATDEKVAGFKLVNERKKLNYE